MKVVKLPKRTPNTCPDTKMACGRKCLGVICIRALESARAAKALQVTLRAKP